MEMQLFATFLFWWMIVNVTIYIISVVGLLVARGKAGFIHEKLFGISEETFNTIAYCYLGAFKLLILVFNFAPWMALRFVVDSAQL